MACALLYSVLSFAVQAQIVAFGASNVSGKGVLPSQAWPAVLEAMLKAKGYNVHVKNAGKAGDTTSGMLHRLSFAIPSGTKIVILDTSGGYYNNSQMFVICSFNQVTHPGYVIVSFQNDPVIRFGLRFR